MMAGVLVLVIVVVVAVTADVKSVRNSCHIHNIQNYPRFPGNRAITERMVRALPRVFFSCLGISMGVYPSSDFLQIPGEGVFILYFICV